MRTKLKKSLIILLTLAVIVGMMPAMAFANGESSTDIIRNKPLPDYQWMEPENSWVKLYKVNDDSTKISVAETKFDYYKNDLANFDYSGAVGKWYVNLNFKTSYFVITEGGNYEMATSDVCDRSVIIETKTTSPVTITLNGVNIRSKNPIHAVSFPVRVDDFSGKPIISEEAGVVHTNSAYQLGLTDDIHHIAHSTRGQTDLGDKFAPVSIIGNDNDVTVKVEGNNKIYVEDFPYDPAYDFNYGRQELEGFAENYSWVDSANVEHVIRLPEIRESSCALLDFIKCNAIVEGVDKDNSTLDLKFLNTFNRVEYAETPGIQGIRADYNLTIKDVTIDMEDKIGSGNPTANNTYAVYNSVNYRTPLGQAIVSFGKCEEDEQFNPIDNGETLLINNAKINVNGFVGGIRTLGDVSINDSNITMKNILNQSISNQSKMGDYRFADYYDGDVKIDNSILDLQTARGVIGTVNMTIDNNSTVNAHTKYDYDNSNVDSVICCEKYPDGGNLKILNGSTLKVEKVRENVADDDYKDNTYGVECKNLTLGENSKANITAAIGLSVNGTDFNLANTSELNIMACGLDDYSRSGKALYFPNSENVMISGAAVYINSEHGYGITVSKPNASLYVNSDRVLVHGKKGAIKETYDNRNVTVEKGDGIKIFESSDSKTWAERDSVNWTEFAVGEKSVTRNDYEPWFKTGSTHQHTWSAWSSNGDNTHSRTCSDTNCTTKTETENHTWKAGTGTDADKLVCTACGATHIHNWSAWTPTANTNFHSRTCSAAGCDVKTEKKEHTWNSGVITTPASCTMAGKMTYTCDECAATKTSNIEMLKHNFTGEWEKNETHHWKACLNGCTAMGETGTHNMSIDTTNTDTSKIVYKCSVCEKTKEVPKENTTNSVTNMVNISGASITISINPVPNSSGSAIIPSGTAIDMQPVDKNNVTSDDETNIQNAVVNAVNNLAMINTGTNGQTPATPKEENVEILQGYDINLSFGGINIQPTGNVQVTVPIPDNTDLDDYDYMGVVYLEDNGNADAVESDVDEDANTISFITDHFSKYIIVGVKKAAVTPTPTPTPSPGGGSGGSSNKGNVVSDNKEEKTETEVVVNLFTDVKESAYYYDAVLWAVEKGITSGVTKTTFVPNDTCTRAQFVTFLWRANGSPAATAASFTDVKADAFYADAVAWAVANGITNGTSEGKFSPNADCTRAQVVTFLYRAFQ